MNTSVTVVFWLVVVCSTALNYVQGKCDKVYEKGVIKKDRQTIVDRHNDLRIGIANGKVLGQPRGVNLKRMRWDMFLASKAQEIANTCDLQSNTVEDKRFRVGQNAIIKSHYKFNRGSYWNATIQHWFEEYKTYTYPKSSLNEAHYTQIVWADSDHVGCGYAHYNDNGDYNKFYVCNYGPGGNVKGEAPYKTGDSGCENLCK